MAYEKTHNVLKFCLLIFVLISFSSCKKYSSGVTTVEIVITNPADGSPFVGVPVKLIEEKNAGGGISSEEFLEGKTDNSGRISFEFQAKRTSKYWYTPVIDDSFFGAEIEWTYLKRPSPSSYMVIKNIYNKIEYEITYYAYLRDEIKNINCEGETDTLFFNAKYLNFDYGSSYYNSSSIQTGCHEYSTTANNTGAPEGHKIVFMGIHIHSYEVHRESGITYGSDTINLDRGEMGTLQTFY